MKGHSNLLLLRLKDFSDVTLVREEHEAIVAHQAILSSAISEGDSLEMATVSEQEEQQAVGEAIPLVMESLVMSVAHHWARRETVDRQVDLLSRHFCQDEMLAALKDLMVLVKQPPPKQRHPSARTATKA